MNQTEVSKFLKPQPVCIQLDESIVLNGDITIPDAASAIVVFVNGSSHGRNKPTNLYVSRGLVEQGIGTLLVDLLTEEEQLRDIESGVKNGELSLLEDRIVGLIDWLIVQDKTTGLKIGMFGTDVTTAAMLLATVRRYKWISTLVSVNGRPDLAGAALPELDCPLLFIVDEFDKKLVRLNKKSLPLLQCQNELSLIPGAAEQLEQPGAVDELAETSISWFQAHLG